MVGKVDPEPMDKMEVPEMGQFEKLAVPFKKEIPPVRLIVPPEKVRTALPSMTTTPPKVAFEKLPAVCVMGHFMVKYGLPDCETEKLPPEIFKSPGPSHAVISALLVTATVPPVSTSNTAPVAIEVMAAFVKVAAPVTLTVLAPEMLREALPVAVSVPETVMVPLPATAPEVHTKPLAKAGLPVPP